MKKRTKDKLLGASIIASIVIGCFSAIAYKYNVEVMFKLFISCVVIFVAMVLIAYAYSLIFSDY